VRGTNTINRISGVYESVCHPMERIILQGQIFPRCGACNHDTNWTFVRKLSPVGSTAGSGASTRNLQSKLKE